MVESLRIGFLGAGLIAEYHSKSIRRAELPFPVERAGVFDPDRSRAERFAEASGHKVAATADEVLDSCDAVYVCTWTSEHLPLVEAAASRGLAVFCEKPLATNLGDAHRVADALITAGVTNQVGLVLRHSPAYLWAAELIAQPEAGRVMSVVFRDDQFIPIQGHYASSWRRDRTKAGAGTLIEHSIHDIDMLQALVGPIGSVNARWSNFHGHDGIEDVVNAVVAFGDDGTTSGTLSSIWHDNLARPSLRRVEIFTERRYVSIDGDWLGPVTWSDADGAVGSLSGEALVEATRHLVPQHANPDAAFLIAAREGVPSFPDARVALRAHEVVDAMYRSAAEGGRTELVGVAAYRIRPATTDEIRPLRLDVLRRGMANQSVTFDGDDDPTTIHFAALDYDDRVVATSSWLERPTPSGRRAIQLRGMATARTLQGTGLGGRLLEAGLAEARRRGFDHVWANARDSALPFYSRHGFSVVGDGFIESVTELPHHVVERRLT